MSIIESLVKLVDPAEALRREQELRSDREQPQRPHASDPPHEFVCRVCDHRATEPGYCPTCLADTMQKVRRP
jgi:rubrerythrin